MFFLCFAILCFTLTFISKSYVFSGCPWSSLIASAGRAANHTCGKYHDGEERWTRWLAAGPAAPAHILKHGPMTRHRTIEPDDANVLTCHPAASKQVVVRAGRGPYICHTARRLPEAGVPGTCVLARPVSGTYALGYTCHPPLFFFLFQYNVGGVRMGVWHMYRVSG